MASSVFLSRNVSLVPKVYTSKLLRIDRDWESFFYCAVSISQNPYFGVIRIIEYSGAYVCLIAYIIKLVAVARLSSYHVFTGRTSAWRASPSSLIRDINNLALIRLSRAIADVLTRVSHHAHL